MRRTHPHPLFFYCSLYKHTVTSSSMRYAQLITDWIIWYYVAECPRGQVFSECAGACPHTCEDLWLHTQCLPAACTPGCTCPPRQVWILILDWLQLDVLYLWYGLNPLYHLNRFCLEVPVCFTLTVPAHHCPSRRSTKVRMSAWRRWLKLLCQLEPSFNTSATLGTLCFLNISTNRIPFCYHH